MNHEDTDLLARHILYGAIDTLATQANLSKEDATILLAGYSVELATFLAGADQIKAMCESAISNGAKLIVQFVKESQP